jgi:hypothetical protein
MSHPDSDVRYHALLSVQQLVSQPWLAVWIVWTVTGEHVYNYSRFHKGWHHPKINTSVTNVTPRLGLRQFTCVHAQSRIYLIPNSGFILPDATETKKARKRTPRVAGNAGCAAATRVSTPSPLGMLI